MAKRRLAALLLERGLVESYEKAQVAVMAGAVLVDDRPAVKPASLVDEAASLRLVAGQRYVGRRGQLDVKLRTDARVVVMEGVNARYLEALPEPVDLATVDVAFISLRQVLPAVRRLLRPGGRLVALFKPQFEAARDEVARGGVVRDPQMHARLIGPLPA